MLRLEHSGNFRNLFLSFPVKPGLPTAPSTVPAKPGLPTAPQHSTSKARAPHSPSTVPAKPGLPQPPSAVPATRDHHRDCLPLSSARRSSQPPGTITGTACLSPAPEEAPSHQGPSQGLPASLQHQKKLPATRDHHRDCLPLSSARRSSQPPGTITGTACLSPAPEEAPSHQGPSQGLPASPQHQKKLPATRDHHRACLSSVNIHWIFIHSNWKHHD